jgi:hypothetical protein
MHVGIDNETSGDPYQVLYRLLHDAVRNSDRTYPPKSAQLLIISKLKKPPPDDSEFDVLRRESEREGTGPRPIPDKRGLTNSLHPKMKGVDVMNAHTRTRMATTILLKGRGKKYEKKKSIRLMMMITTFTLTLPAQCCTAFRSGLSFTRSVASSFFSSNSSHYPIP